MPRHTSVCGFGFALILGAMGLAPQMVSAQQGLAYVVGNERYGADRLDGPADDALEMSRALIGLGFDVIRRQNTDANTLALGNRAADTVVLYFSGRTEVREGVTYLMGAQLGDAPSGGWPVMQTAQKFRAAGAKNVLVFVQNCYMPEDTATLPAEEADLDGISISYAMSDAAECAATAEDEMGYSQRLLAALDTSGVGVMNAFKALPGQAMIANGLKAPVVLGATASVSSDVTVTSDAVVISAPVNRAVQVTAVAPVTVTGSGTGSGTTVSGAVQSVAFTPIRPSSTGTGGVQIFNAAPRAAPQAVATAA
ncbi:MAG: caspase family protein, partial [Ascidiaceihabitans sp.]